MSILPSIDCSSREADSRGPERTERELVRRTASDFSVTVDEVERRWLASTTG
jgi:hypothetical protein